MKLKYKAFENEIISHLNIWIKFETSAEVSKYLKAHKLCDKGVSSTLETSMTNWVQIFTGLLFYASTSSDTQSEKPGLWQYYQRSPVPLKHRPIAPTSTQAV